MVCKKCEKEFPEGYRFCPYCGESIEDAEKLHEETMPAEKNKGESKKSAEESQEKSGCAGCFGTLIILLIAFLVIFWVFGDGCSFFSREATNQDIVVETSLNLGALGADLEITPKCDIDDLEITINFYDDKYNLIKTTVKFVGDVEEGEKKSVTVSLTEFSFYEISQIEHTKVSVSGGTASSFD